MYEVILLYNGDPSRRDQYLLTRAHYEHHGYQVITGSCEGWSKGEAAADAVSRSTADPLVICDADLLVHPEVLAEAITLAGSLVIPFNRVLNLSDDGTRVEKVRERFAWAGGCWVLSRDSYEAVGGVDPRFREWGGEDEAFCRAVECLVGPLTLLEGDAWHLWHPPNPGKHTWKRTPNYTLYRQYRAAMRKPAKMRELLGIQESA